MTNQTASMAEPKTIDIAEFARHGKVIVGEIAARDLARLQDLIAAGSGRLNYQLRGGYSPRREPQITCIIQGLVSLECQRCLTPFDQVLDISSTLVFVADESQLPAIEEEDESVDYVLAEKTLDVLALIEDEVILALPVAPRHETSKCRESAEPEATMSSPFAALAKLKPSADC